MNKEFILKALLELRKLEKRKFNQTVDLIINLREFNIKKENINLFIDLPHKVKDKKICGFLEKKSEALDTITEPEFIKYKDKELKKLSKKYDFFISVAKLMPAVAKSFGKVLGPLGKMPSPKLGLLPNEEEKVVSALMQKINKTVRVVSKEPSLKIPIGKEDMKDGEIVENILKVYDEVLKALPRKKENLQSILIKFTMTKPVKVGTK